LEGDPHAIRDQRPKNRYQLHIIIGSALNRPTQDWGVFLGDVPAATAILDRFLAHATLVQMTGKSYRLRQRASPTDD
jgi:DNA replication protein DnaC